MQSDNTYSSHPQATHPSHDPAPLQQQSQPYGASANYTPTGSQEAAQQWAGHLSTANAETTTPGVQRPYYPSQAAGFSNPYATASSSQPAFGDFGNHVQQPHASEQPQQQQYGGFGTGATPALTHDAGTRRTQAGYQAGPPQGQGSQGAYAEFQGGYASAQPQQQQQYVPDPQGASAAFVYQQQVCLLLEAGSLMRNAGHAAQIPLLCNHREQFFGLAPVSLVSCECQAFRCFESYQKPL